MPREVASRCSNATRSGDPQPIRAWAKTPIDNLKKKFPTYTKDLDHNREFLRLLAHAGLARYSLKHEYQIPYLLDRIKRLKQKSLSPDEEKELADANKIVDEFQKSIDYYSVTLMHLFAFSLGFDSSKNQLNNGDVELFYNQTIKDEDI